MVIKETMSHISFQDITTVPILEETRNVTEDNKRKQRNKKAMNNQLELVRKEKHDIYAASKINFRKFQSKEIKPNKLHPERELLNDTKFHT